MISKVNTKKKKKKKKKVNTYFFYIFINVCKGRGYGDLAANIGPKSENPFTNTISTQSFNCLKESVFRQFRTSHASHGWEAVSNHMWPDKPVRQGREPT